MSQKEYTTATNVISDSEEEQELNIVTDSDSGEDGLFPPSPPPPLPPKKRRYRVGKDGKPQIAKPVIDEDDDEVQPKAPKKSKKRAHDATDGSSQAPVVLPSTSSSTGAVFRSLTNSSEAAWQKGMDLALGILVPLKVDHKELTLLPDAGTLECFRKAVQAWMGSEKVFVNYTYTTQKSFQSLVGRIIFDMVLRSAGLDAGKWNPSSLAVWRHGCQGRLMCLHGSVMLSKDQLIEMDVNSENGQRALRETPDKCKIISNRWGRQVVQLKNCDAMCCALDAGSTGGNFSSKSCGVFFTEGSKALQAFDQISAFQRACYPKMAEAGDFMLLPTKCDCNYGPSGIPLLGRQLPKITPYNINATAAVDKNQVEDPKMLATLNNPSVLVFQCCNPVRPGSKGVAGKNCDMKISSVDVVSAVQLAKRMWQSTTNTQPVCKFPEFKWSPEYQVQNTILPQGVDDTDESLF